MKTIIIGEIQFVNYGSTNADEIAIFKRIDNIMALKDITPDEMAGLYGNYNYIVLPDYEGQVRYNFKNTIKRKKITFEIDTEGDVFETLIEHIQLICANDDDLDIVPGSMACLDQN